MDRLVDDRHAVLVAAAGSLLTRAGWEVLPEVTYSRYGERGSIDLVAWHAIDENPPHHRGEVGADIATRRRSGNTTKRFGSGRRPWRRGSDGGR